jgi:hypothetical protein
MGETKGIQDISFTIYGRIGVKESSAEINKYIDIYLNMEVAKRKEIQERRGNSKVK